MNAEDKATIKEFKHVVNMTPKRLEDWLETKESKEVGFKESECGESVGHQSGKRIVKLLGKNEADFSADDIKHARKWWVTCTAIWPRNRMATLLKRTGAIR
jgi:hypothetical protein